MLNTEAVFAGCNRELQVFDYNSDTGAIAYGAQNLVAVTSSVLTSNLSVQQVLKGHTAQITVVKWIPTRKILLSGAEDGKLNVWKYEDGGSFQLSQTLVTEQVDSSITCLTVSNDNVIITGNASGFITIWKIDEQSQFTQFASFSIEPEFYALTLAVIEVAPGKLIAFIGGTKAELYVYTFDLTDSSSVKQTALLTGHEDWIKSLAVRRVSDVEYLIASGSQDRWIRLWKLCLNEKIDTSDEDKTKLRLLSNKLYKFNIGEDVKCAVNFDAIIMGHDDWISGLQWHPTECKLLSSSSDSSVMIWEPDPISGVWISKVRLGEITIKGASTATGSAGGFWCAQWIITGKNEIILTNGKTGSFRCWKRQAGSSVFNQLPAITGPVRDSTDVQWSKSGKYLLATSLDQTTRLFARWTKHGGDNSWHEFARPQIHGYDMICIKPISDTRFISAGDEKVIRVFDEPRAVAQLLDSLTDVSEDKKLEMQMPESASLPVLGLSNKAELQDIQKKMQEEADEVNEEEDQTNKQSASAPPINMLSGLEYPPLEDQLDRFTLWPEVEKLYGHGFEITTIDVSPDGKLVASACRSNVAKQAVIRLFRTDNWQQLKQTLPGHELTITRLRWSPNGNYLLSVSRDRQFSLWEKKDIDSEITFKLISLQEKAHTRIIWDCCWLPIEIDACMFITGARDRRMKLWKMKSSSTVENITRSDRHTSAVTALDCYDKPIGKLALIATGLDDGSILLYTVSADGKFNMVYQQPVDATPNGSITRLSFRPSSASSKDGIELAVSARDSSVRILKFSFNELGL